MEAKELRIGNYYDGVRGIEQLTNAESLQEIESYPEKFKPIPLTEEWLLKFGFEFPQGEFCIKGKLKIVVDCDPFIEVGKSGVELEYVHQLQNLYFALTGEELSCE